MIDARDTGSLDVREFCDGNNLLILLEIKFPLITDASFLSDRAVCAHKTCPHGSIVGKLHLEERPNLGLEGVESDAHGDFVHTPSRKMADM